MTESPQWSESAGRSDGGTTGGPNRPTGRRRRLLIGLTAGVSGAVIGGTVVAGLLTGGFADAASGQPQPAAPGTAAPAKPAPQKLALQKRLQALRNDQRVIGTLASIGGNSITVTADGTGRSVSVPTTNATRVRGLGKNKRSISDLKPGDRVMVFVAKTGSAVLVVDVHGGVVGTVTALAGDIATIERPDGLTQQVDLSKVTTKPKVGDVVRIAGQPAGGGATLLATKVVVLPAR